MDRNSGASGARVGLATKATRFWAGSAAWRKEYGTLAGLRVALALRGDYSRPPGSRYPVHVLGLRHPLELRAATADVAIFTQLCQGGDLDFPLSRAPEYILDAGAHIGVASAILASRFPAAHILAVEPEPENFASLQRNTSGYPRITTLEAAVWGHDGVLALSETVTGAEHMVQAHSLADPGSPGESLRRVPAWSVGSLLARIGWPRFDLVKLDIEGAELEVLQAGGLAWLDGTSVLVVELHDRFRKGCREAFEAALQGRGFELSTSGEYQIARRVPRISG